MKYTSHELFNACLFTSGEVQHKRACEKKKEYTEKECIELFTKVLRERREFDK